MKIDDILVTNIYEAAKRRGKKKKNGITVMSVEEFLSQSLTEAPLKMGAEVSTPFSDDDMQAYLDRIKTKNKTQKDRFNKPYIHGSNIVVKDDSGETYDTDALRKLITTRPSYLLKQNEKMQHSDGTDEVFFNIGLPALRGLAVDEDTGEFVIVNTCPGAGKCKIYCYAKKGGYVQFPDSSKLQSQTLNFLLNDPSGFEARLKSEIEEAYAANNKKDTKVTVRWHDAGDFFSPDYLAMAMRVAKSFPDIDFYAYTKIASTMKGKLPPNFRMNFSMGALNSEEKHIDRTTTKNSIVVDKELFSDLIAMDGRKKVKDAKGRTQFKSRKELDTFKDRLAKEYNVNKSTILTYDEMMSKNLGTESKWNVIVMPGDGDNSANNPGVLTSFLLFH